MRGQNFQKAQAVFTAPPQPSTEGGRPTTLAASSAGCQAGTVLHQALLPAQRLICATSRTVLANEVRASSQKSSWKSMACNNKSGNGALKHKMPGTARGQSGLSPALQAYAAHRLEPDRPTKRTECSSIPKRLPLWLLLRF